MDCTGNGVLLLFQRSTVWRFPSHPYQTLLGCTLAHRSSSVRQSRRVCPNVDTPMSNDNGRKWLHATRKGFLARLTPLIYRAFCRTACFYR